MPPAPTDAAAQLERLLAIVPRIADGEEHSIKSIADALGVTPETVANDLVSVGERYDTPGGFIEGLQVFIDAEQASVRTSHFLRPMRLTVADLDALDLGLAMIRGERTPDERPVIDAARKRIEAAVIKLPGDTIAESAFAAPGALAPSVHLRVIRESLALRRKLRIAYRRGDSTSPVERVVCPYRLILAGPGWYLVAHCERSNGVRIFRLDRINEAQMLPDKYSTPATDALTAHLENGPVFESDAPATLRIRYSARIARWIRERHEGITEADGAYVVEHPLADVEWAIRHVLQYGAEAEVVAPAAVRQAVRERLNAMLSTL
ncbi:MAG TPA: WYL domain-containing protein [Gemmatimonadaceae bacterium]|nr:WYL domain-containing protein [Gemmatimonadaceae bacterium]